MPTKKDEAPEQDAPDFQDQQFENTPDPEAAEKAEKADRGPIDRITNQPLSDFMPAADGDHAETVRVMNEAVVASRGAAARANLTQNAIDAAEAEQARREEAEANLKAIQEQTKAMFKEINFVPPDVYFARENARVKMEAQTLGTKEIRPGGEFIVNGVRVDANGDAL